MSKLNFLEELDAEVLKKELLTFLCTQEVEVDSMEKFQEQFVEFIKEDLSDILI